MQEFREGSAINHRYRVVKRLGRGAMGTVYLTEDLINVHRLVALKVLESGKLDDPDFWSKGEYDALTRLRHPNLARVHDFGRIHSSDDFYLVSEYIRGQDLLTATRGIEYEELLDVIVQTCRALEYIHSQGYVHFDVKPDNILVTRERTVGADDGSKVQWSPDAPPSGSQAGNGPPRVKMIDFGLAERITGTFEYAIKGTLHYVAPEIIRGRTPDKRADLYSFGVTLFRILTEQYPFVAADGKPSPRSGNWRDDVRRATGTFPAHLQDIVVRLLEVEVEDRFASAREIIHALNAGAGQRYEIETTETQASYLYCSRLVGRQKELNRLKEEAESIFSVPLVARPRTARGDTTVVTRLLRDDRRKRTPLFLLEGEIGIGKTRLFEEFTHFLRMREIQVHQGNSYENSHDAYQPFREIIGQMALSLGMDHEVCVRHGAMVRRLCPRLRGSDAREETETGFRPDKERLYFIDGLAHFLVSGALALPCVLVMNNLHWADEASIELLGRLVELLGQQEQLVAGNLPVMLVATMRTDETPLPALRALLSGLREEDRVRDIHLRRFSRTQIAELIHAMLQIEEIPTPFLDRLEERTSGNPMFLVETLKGLQEEGIIYREGADWRVRGDLRRIEIPRGIEAILLRRMRMLEPHQRQVLEALSTYGKPMTSKLLERFPQFAETQVLHGLRDLQNRGMVTKQLEAGRLAFEISQPKLREIIYDHLPEERRKVLHGCLADALIAEHGGSADEIIEDLAYHYQRSDRVGRALEFTARAGDILRGIFAHERAVSHYRHVLQQTEGAAAHFLVWVETHEKIGDVGLISGDFELAVASFEILLSRDLRAQLPPDAQARLLCKRGKVCEIQGEYSEALRHYKEARELLERDPAGLRAHHHERIRTLNAIGWGLVCLGQFEKAMAICVEALRLLEGVEEQGEHALLFSTIGCANFYKGNLEQAIEFHSRALEIRENLEHVPDIIVSLNHLGEAILASADHVEALKHFEQALLTAEQIGDAYGRAMALHHIAQTWFSLGDAERVEVSLRESLRLSRHFRMRFLTNQNYFLQGRLLARQGDLGKAEACLYRALGVTAKQGNRWALAGRLLEVARVQLRRGECTDALRLIREALACAHALNSSELEARCRVLEVRALRVQGDEDLAALLGRLQAASEQLAHSRFVELRAEIEIERGELLVTLHDYEAARQAYAWAQEHFREIADRLPASARESYLALHAITPGTAEGLVEFREVSVGVTPGEARRPGAGAGQGDPWAAESSAGSGPGRAGARRPVGDSHAVEPGAAGARPASAGAQAGEIAVAAREDPHSATPGQAAARPGSGVDRRLQVVGRAPPEEASRAPPSGTAAFRRGFETAPSSTAAAPATLAAEGQLELLRVANLLQEMHQGGSPRVFLQRVLTCVVQATGTGQGFVLACGSEEGLRVAAAADARGQGIKRSGDFICVEALEVALDSSLPILATNVLDNPDTRQHGVFYRHDIARLAVVPLRLEGITRGLLYLNNPDPVHLVPPHGGPVLLAYQSLLALLLPRPVATQA